MDSSVFEFGHNHCNKYEFQPKINNRMANSVDPDEMACFVLPHLDLHYLQKYLSWTPPFFNLDITLGVNRSFSKKSGTKWQTV